MNACSYYKPGLFYDLCYDTQIACIYNRNTSINKKVFNILSIIHIIQSKNNMATKTCKKCEQRLPITEFKQGSSIVNCLNCNSATRLHNFLSLNTEQFRWLPEPRGDGRQRQHNFLLSRADVLFIQSLWAQDRNMTAARATGLLDERLEGRQQAVTDYTARIMQIHPLISYKQARKRARQMFKRYYPVPVL